MATAVAPCFTRVKISTYPLREPQGSRCKGPEHGRPVEVELTGVGEPAGLSVSIL